MITKRSIDEIMQTARIEEVIGDFMQLKKSGSNYKGLSPFSNEKTPSFMVSPAKQIFKDFSSGKGGNVITFLKEHETMSYPEALRYLAGKYNIELEEEEMSEEKKEEHDRRESLYVVTSFAENYFSEQLRNSDEGRSVGLSYFHDRGLSDEVIDKFSLGYCSEDWSTFTDHALNNGYKLEFLEETGLTKTKNDKHYDFFRGRVIFPIHDLTGRPIGFGGRTLRTDKNVAKYFNSPESPIYNKSQVLYGMHLARKAVVKKEECYLVEGYTDVISLHQAGVENVVAASGTSLTQEQVRLIRRYTSNITMLFDGDPAGLKASLRGIDLVLEEGMNVKIVLFPEGEDPDSYARSVSQEELQQFLQKNARDFIVFKAGLLAEDAGQDPVKRSDLIREIVQSIALIPDHILRSEYIRECSRIMGVDERPLINEINKLRRKKWRDQHKQQEQEEKDLERGAQLPPPEQPVTKEGSGIHQERELIRILLNYGEDHFSVTEYDQETNAETTTDENVAEFILHELTKDGLTLEDPTYSRVFELFREAYQNNRELPSQQFFLTHQDESVAQLATDLITSPHELSENWREKHKIHTKPESRRLKSTVRQSVFSFKLKRIEHMIRMVREKLQEDHSMEKHRQFLEQQHRLLEAKKTFSEELGRVVVR